jgi:hypothetical protein
MTKSSERGIADFLQDGEDVNEPSDPASKATLRFKTNQTVIVNGI